MISDEDFQRISAITFNTDFDNRRDIEASAAPCVVQFTSSDFPRHYKYGCRLFVCTADRCCPVEYSMPFPLLSIEVRSSVEKRAFLKQIQLNIGRVACVEAHVSEILYHTMVT